MKAFILVVASEGTLPRLKLIFFSTLVALLSYGTVWNAYAIETDIKPAITAAQPVALKLSDIRALNNPLGVTNLTKQIYGDFHTLVRTQKIAVADAVRKQRAALAAHPDVAEVRELKGNNLFVRFKDNNELLMLMGDQALGGSPDDSLVLAQNDTPLVTTTTQVQGTMAGTSTVQAVFPTPLPALWSASPYALVFDTLRDDMNVVNPLISDQVADVLKRSGYSVHTVYNDAASLKEASMISEIGYGLVFLRGHGGSLGNDFAFMVRPWYASYPAVSSYTGTIRVSADNHKSGKVEYAYAITGTFGSTYWKKRFPGTVFFLESCHGTDPGALPGMPTWVLNHGASAWFGWNDLVTFNCGDNGSKLFFDQAFARGKTIAESLEAVSNTGCRPPDLSMHSLNPGAMGAQKFNPWMVDEEQNAARDIRSVNLFTQGNNLYANIYYGFHNSASPEGIELFVDGNNDGVYEFLVKCHDAVYEVNTLSGQRVYNTKVFASAPVRTDLGGGWNSYLLDIPWDTLGAGPARVSVNDVTGGDKAPNSGFYTGRRN